MQSSSIRIFGLAALIGLSAGILHAASDTWDGGNSAMWADGTNWVGDAVAPGSGETATFSGAGNGNTTINLGAGTTVGALAFDTASAAAYTIGSGGVGAQTLTLTTPSDTPAVSVSSSVVNDQTIHANILHNTADNTLRLVNNNATQALTVSGTIQGGSGTSQRIINSTGNVSLNGAVSAGSASSSPNLAQVAAGTLTLGGSASSGLATLRATAGGAKAVVNGQTVTVSSESDYGNVSSTFQILSGSAAFNGGIRCGTSNGVLSGADGQTFKVSGGTFTAASVRLGRSQAFEGVQSNPNITSGFIVEGGSAAVSGNVELAGGNSSVGGLLSNGSLTVGGELIIGNRSSSPNGSRYNVFQVKGGTLTSTDTASGVVLARNATIGNKGQFLLTGGTATVEKISFGISTSATSGSGTSYGVLTLGNSSAAGTLYLGSGGIVKGALANYAATVSLVNGTLGAKADWTSSLDMSLAGSGVTVQAADATGTARNITLSGALSGANGFTKTGGGTLTLSGANTYAGSTVIQQGALALGSAGSLTGPVFIRAGAEFSPTAAYAPGDAEIQFEISGSDSYGLLAAEDAVNVTGVDLVVVTNNYAPVDGDEFVLVTADSITGPFASLSLPNLSGTLSWDVSYAGNAITLTVVETGAGPGPTYWWDADGTLPIGGTGAWDTTAKRWRSPLSNDTASVWNNALPSTAEAIFAGQAGTVTITETALNIHALTFLGTGHLLTGGELDFSDNAPSLVQSTGIGTNTLATVLASAHDIVFAANDGVLALAATNTYRGDTVVSNGVVQLRADNIIPDGSDKGNVSVLGLLDLNGHSDVVNGLSGTGTINSLAAGTSVLTVGANDQTSTFNGSIANASGSVALKKIGSGTLTLYPNNTYTGGTTLGGGTLYARHGTALGTGTILFEGGTLQSHGDWDYINAPLHVDAGQTGTLRMGERTEVNGALTGGGTLHVIAPSTIARDYWDAPTMAFTGTIQFSGGWSIEARINGGDFNGFDNATLHLDNEMIRFRCNTGGNTVRIGALTGTASGVLSGSTYGGSVTIEIGGKNLDTTFPGTIGDEERATTLKKVGTGTLTLSGSVTVSGDTLVQAGTLVVNGSVATNVAVAAGATLAGSGTISGLVSLAAGDATIDLVTGATNTLTLANGLSLAAGNVLRFDAGDTTDQIVMTGGVLSRTGLVSVEINSMDGLKQSQSYPLIVGAGLDSPAGFKLEGTLPAGWGAILEALDGDLVLTLTDPQTVIVIR